MSKECKQPHCFAPDVPCHLGEEDKNKCSLWKEANGHAAPGQGAPSEDLLLPWSGSSLGTVDLPFVVGRSNATVIGIVGPHNSGKTTLLAAWYLLLGQGHRVPHHLFAGSYTMNGWESIAHSLRWEGPTGPTFPLHTSSGSGRSPGLLHAAFRRGEFQSSDFLFADAPGEWFKRWAINREAEDAVGARWVAYHAELFLLIADCEALSGPSKGNARNALQLMAQRLGAERQRRPVALVWSKSDITVSDEIRHPLRELAHRTIPDLKEFSVSVYPSEKESDQIGENHMALLEWVMTQDPIRAPVPSLPLVTDDPFLAFGRV